MPERNPYLLPHEAEPTHYEIELQPDLKKFTFAGSETISLQIHQRTSQIVLHAVELEIHKAQFIALPESVPLDATRVSWDRDKETVKLSFGRPLEKGPAELYLEFTGELNDKLHGFYRTAYQAGGQKRWGAATQFEATDARRCFPCWDEPARKATFRIALTVPERLVALSNMPVRQWSRAKPGWKRVEYERTPRMPTYLVAFVIAELECLEATDSDGIPIRVWTRPGKKEQGRFALEQACHTLPYFAEWFGIPYAFPKMDMVSLPDFASGAMENWGLVTYRETALLVDPENSSQSARQRVAHVVDHELAHQWFGNYTTMEWWTDLWLNEGFASYMGPKATDHLFPEWDIWTQYVGDDFEGFLAAVHEDGLKNTHPVEVPVKNPHEIREVFDSISYSKGSLVNRMLAHYLGEENFRKGLNLYLSRHAYGNATTMELWQALEEASGKPVSKMMAGYTRQPGYPVLRIKSQLKNGNLQLDVEQTRFLLDGSRDPKQPLWQIPIGLLRAGADAPRYEFMKTRRQRLSVPLSDGAWLKLNPGQTGIYRVAYSEDLWQRLIPAIESKALPATDRLGLLDDAFALAQAGYWKTSSALQVLEAFRSETDFSVWRLISAILSERAVTQGQPLKVFGPSSLDSLLARESFYPAFLEMGRDLFQPLAARMGWEKRPGDGHLEVLLRALALRNLGGYGDPDIQAEAKDRFARFVRSGELDPDLRQAVYSLVAESGGEREWRQLRKIYRSTDLQEEKSRVLRASGSFRDRDALQQLLDFSLSEEVRSQDTWIAMTGAATHPLGRALAWKFLKKHWKTFVSRYGGGGLNLLIRVVAIPRGFTTRAELGDAQEFFRRHQAPGTERAVKKALELARANVRWLERDRTDLTKYFGRGTA